MGRKFAPVEAPSYYPPRARWYASFFYLTDLIGRHLRVERFALPREITVGGVLAAFLVPGLGFYLRGLRLWGYAAIAACATLLAVYAVWLGYPAANLAFGLMMSIHSSAFVYYCNPVLANESLRWRLGFTLAASVGIMAAVYWPARDQIQAHLLTPVRMNDRVIIVSKVFKTRLVRRGQWVAYSLHRSDQDDYGTGMVRIHSGVSLGEVLAVAGDTVTFEHGRFSVNGDWRSSLPHMPVSGTLTVAENHWFIWPDLAINGGHGNVSQADIAQAVLGLASVSPEQFLGRPFHRWFWRRQILP